ncbi:hypothetical protein [Neorhizobium galegae]|uniref:hypothetical protein n=1 Tax=Neorhizobium galegae TaxID=399 RepID=UPI00062109A6|nr:hypothetical protein [Neorhizobium galegae]CDZ27369.1 Hypothetical protein NGAL_HAMBI490_22130 [Neorhizobium galegae bv. officinalis]KAA9387279.1 hypothetical protein F4V88_12800 [Neorhizobium galegae]KAB1114425.1 hypothetical protein F4V89_08460 [Neorhizobium galegae]MCM2497546.1 hypothetical protein [Neorhizobium galegae]MCQ1771636.1 hypothetical protein [Neorhizobium galegae]
MNTAKDTPILAMRAGTYRERPAHGPFSRLFSRVWSHRLPQEFEGQIAVMPDGCADLIRAGGQLLVIGPHRTAAFPALHMTPDAKELTTLTPKEIRRQFCG